MIVSAQFANAERTAVSVLTDDRGAVSMSVDAPEYKAWPGVTAAFVPLDVTAIDLAELNRALTAEGSVSRAMGEVLFGVIKGTIPIPQPNLTKQQFVVLLNGRQRT